MAVALAHAPKRKAGKKGEDWISDFDSLTGCSSSAPQVGPPADNSAELTPAVVTEDLPLGLLEDHPDNPEPSEAEIVRMMGWLQESGQAEPIHVRGLWLLDTGGDIRYQVLAGRTRLAAARRLGWPALRAEIHAGLADDMAAAGFAARSNLERRQEGPLRQAAWGQALIERRLQVTCADRQITSPDRTEAMAWAAGQMGLSVEGLRNKLRFNQLREPWRSRLTPGQDGEAELSERVARSLLPYANIPQLLAIADKNFRLKPQSWDRWKWQDEHEIARMMRLAVDRTTGPLDGTGMHQDYGHELGYNHPCYFSLDKLDEATRARLQIVEVPDSARNCTRQVCLNLKEYLRINTPLVKEKVAAKKLKQSAGSRGKSGTESNGKPVAKSKAELAAEAKRQAELLQARVDYWRHRWLLPRIAAAMSECDWQLQRVWLMLVCSGDWLARAQGNVATEDILAAACVDAGVTAKFRKRAGKYDQLDTHKIWARLCSVPLQRFTTPEIRENVVRQQSYEFREISLHYVRRVLALDEKNKDWPVVPYQVADQLAIDYGVDLDKAWSALQGRAGNGVVQLDWEPFLELFHLPQLIDLCSQWQIHAPDNVTAKGLRQIVLSQQRTLPRPKIVRNLQPAYQKAKAAKKPRGLEGDQ